MSSETVANTENNPEDNAEEQGASAAAEQKAAAEQAGDAEGTPWPENWREHMARHVAGDDDDSYKRELRRLERVKDPAGVYGNYREIESRYSSSGLVKVPGANATEEEIAAYRKGIGMPDDPKELIANIKLSNGAALGEADMPIAEQLISAMHKGSTPQEMINHAVEQYLVLQESQMAALDDMDKQMRENSARELREELGHTYDRDRTNLRLLFEKAPGVPDMELYSEIFGGRTMSGHLLGDYNPFLRWAINANKDLHPRETVVEDGVQSGMSIDDEIREIEAMWKDPKTKAAYYKDEPKQARYRDLLDARERYKARA